ncbi:hypothetical protein [Limnovirga soli]|uniref:Uncharacterized protein n=1 Tax=Limnovirga soli TaxID=2656915 RepID=A0A8J8FF94_9BACT|nr:hypothetical protein [Limnovirga soli]NNV55522.1 hypothetical protein [Limnovirga soli]
MLPVYSRNRFSLLQLFFYLFLLEVCIGGSGGFIKEGAVSLRKVDFVIAMGICFFIYYFKNKIESDILLITGAFLALIGTSAFIGLLHYGNDVRVYENFLMQSFFLLLPFYALFINNKHQVERVIDILKISAVILAVVYLIVLLLIVFKIVPFLTVYYAVAGNEDIMGRGTGAFWYKGFIYLCVGIYFWLLDKRFVLKWLLQLMMLTAIFFTFSRGFFVALFLTGIIYNFFFGNLVKSMGILFISIIAVVFFNQYYVSLSFDRTESDYVRTTQIQQVYDRIDLPSFFIGHGFGEGVPVRDNHLEINYLEIFHKQGIIGIIFWLAILAYITLGYINIKKCYPENEAFARPFLLSAYFTYFESLTNPYLTNSIGMNLIMLTIVCFSVLKKHNA